MTGRRDEVRGVCAASGSDRLVAECHDHAVAPATSAWELHQPMRPAIALALLVSCGGGGGGRAPVASPSRASCEELVEHVVDLAWLAHAAEVSEGHGTLGTWSDGYGEERHEYKKKLRATKGAALIARCAHATGPHVDCALAAESIDAVSTCHASLSLDAR